jgi:hypothetical protein
VSRTVYLLQDEVGYHGRRCGCKRCDKTGRIGRSIGIGVYDVSDDYEVVGRKFGPTEQAALTAALDFCKSREYKIVEEVDGKLDMANNKARIYSEGLSAYVTGNMGDIVDATSLTDEECAVAIQDRLDELMYHIKSKAQRRPDPVELFSASLEIGHYLVLLGSRHNFINDDALRALEERS